MEGGGVEGCVLGGVSLDHLTRKTPHWKRIICGERERTVRVKISYLCYFVSQW